jgi:tetratricopeptide (TPR) repeat protein
LLVLGGCQGFGPPGTGQVEPLRISEKLGEGDPARRASTRLVVQGLESDVRGETDRAQGSYERAIQVDATNPYAYLALARHHLDGEEPRRALHLLDQADALFEAEGGNDPRVDVHMMGLRGRAFHAIGRGEDGVLYLEHARELAPEIWSDGYLSAAELL